MATYKNYVCNYIFYTTNITSSTISNIPFRISVSGNTIYEGKMYKIPGTSTCSININKICREYLSTNIPDLDVIVTTTSVPHPEAYIPFVLSTYNVQSDAWVNVNTYYFLNYSDIENARGKDITGNINLNNPVNGHMTTNMLAPLTVFVYSATTNNVRTGFTTTGNTYYHTGYCTRADNGNAYAIYYVNSKGGIDAFLFEGVCSKNNTFDIYKYTKSYDNQTQNFGDTRYANLVKNKYELNTGVLNDGESERFAKEVLGSNQIILQNLSNGTFEPVIITDTNVKYKTYKNEDSKPVEYTLTVESSQTNYRK